MSNLNLNFFGQFMGHMGIPIHSRGFAKELNKHLNLKMYQILPFNNEDVLSVPTELTSKLTFASPIQKAISVCDKNNPSLIFWYPSSMMKCSNFNIGYYIFEYTVIPQEFIDKLNMMDIICTASEWGVEILKDNGVKTKCVAVPAGVDPSTFNSKERILDNRIFKFLHIGKAENRKNTVLTIKAFNETFKGDPNIRLTLSIDNPHIHYFNAEAFLYELFGSDELKYGINNIDIIHFVDNIKDLYNTHHVGIFPSCAEGIGLPIIEAMACGMPVIIPFNSGITEYANDSNSILLKDLKTIGVYDPYFFPASGQFGTWQTPTLEELTDKLKICYEHFSEVELIGKTAETFIREEYNWELAANKFVELLK